MRKTSIEKQGNYLLANLDGVDFTSSGVMEGNSYGASVKLRFITKVDVIKKVGATEIKTKKAVSQIMKIPSTDEALESEVAKYNKLIGQDMLINFIPPDNNTFTVSPDIQIEILDEKVKV